MPARLIVVALMVCSAGLAHAATPLVGPGATEAVSTARKAVDESALRYYASLKQTTRVEAETRRLRRLHPDWEPPADLWTARLPGPEETPLWELYAADRIGELRAAITARQAEHPGWSPSNDLDAKLRRKEIRLVILAASQTGRWSEVAASAADWRAQIDAEDVEMLWLVAESFSRGRRSDDARQVLEAVLATRTDLQERIATIQKALALLPMRDAERLIHAGRREANGGSEFDTIATDITRARISAWLHDAPGDEISAAELVKFQDYAAADADPRQAALLAWYALKRDDLREALEQFKASIAKGGDAIVAHGLAHTLRRLGRLRDAEEVAYAWREPSPANSILFIDILAEQLTGAGAAVDSKRLARYAEVTMQTASGEGAQALAWYAYNACQFDAASEWFKRAMAWFPKEATAYGYALTLRRLKRTQDYLDIVNRYDGLFPSAVALLYPDDTVTKDDPCDRKPAKPTAAEGPRPILDVAQTARAIVPLPAKSRPEPSRDRGGPKAGEFPIAVAAENPLRAQVGDRPRSAVGAWRSATATAPQLSARRVPGVGAMPYERYGVTLAPAWNGAQQPAASADIRLRSPHGTSWAVDLAAAEIASTNPAGRATALPGDPRAASRFHP